MGSAEAEQGEAMKEGNLVHGDSPPPPPSICILVSPGPSCCGTHKEHFARIYRLCNYLPKEISSALTQPIILGD